MESWDCIRVLCILELGVVFAAQKESFFAARGVREELFFPKDHRRR